MSAAYVDTSCLVAVAFDEPGGRAVADAMGAARVLLSANLLEAELKAALAREGAPTANDLLARLTWILPDRALGAEIDRALAAGYTRGADLWHLAVALYLAPDPSELPFLTLDSRQAAAAAALGCPLPLPDVSSR